MELAKAPRAVGTGLPSAGTAGRGPLRSSCATPRPTASTSTSTTSAASTSRRLGAVRRGGRVALCGAVSGYERVGPRHGPRRARQVTGRGRQQRSIRCVQLRPRDLPAQDLELVAQHQQLNVLHMQAAATANKRTKQSPHSEIEE